MQLSSNWKKLQAQTSEQEMAASANATDHESGVPPVLGKRKRISSDESIPKSSNAQNLERRKFKHRRLEPKSTQTQNAVRSARSPKEAPNPPPILTTQEPPCPKPTVETATVIDKDPPSKIGKYLAIDCEMLETDISSKTLGRVSIVDYENKIVLDTFVQPPPGAQILDYRTRYSGLSPALIATGRPFEEVRARVTDLIRDRILVGHAIGNEFAAMQLSHPRKMIRDTQLSLRYRRLVGTKHPGLRKCTKAALGLDIQSGAHDSVEDARATMLLYKLHRKDIDREQG